MKLRASCGAVTSSLWFALQPQTFAAHAAAWRMRRSLPQASSAVFAGARQPANYRIWKANRTDEPSAARSLTMTDPHTSAGQSLRPLDPERLAKKVQIDRLCGLFEADWKAGRRPQLES